jgi:hypothetical protein
LTKLGEVFIVRTMELLNLIMAILWKAENLPGSADGFTQGSSAREQVH